MYVKVGICFGDAHAEETSSGGSRHREGGTHGWVAYHGCLQGAQELREGGAEARCDSQVAE